ncbi:alpha/beta hydrolase family protein [Comamonas humi]
MHFSSLPLASRRSWRAWAGAAAALWLAAGAAAAAPQPAECPRSLPGDARCYSGQDEAGAFYWMALPAGWKPADGVLVMHTHGGPELGKPGSARTRADLDRWSIMVRAGYAWAGSTYRRGGYGVTMAAEDTERLRQLFVQKFGQPRRTVLHGQSYGGGVASIAAERYAPAAEPGTPPAPSPYDGLLLTNGVLGGGVDAYRFRLDLRAVYQYVCGNHPKSDEPQYPLWMGLPAGAHLTRAELAERVKECTGVGLPVAQRSAAQQQRLRSILAAVRIEERSLVAHLAWGTFLFRDLVQQRLGGRNPWGNQGVVYGGVDAAQQAALNAGVARYAADPQAQGMLSADSRPTGRTRLPTLTLHAIHDPTAFVELEHSYRAIRRAAGTDGHLVQTFSDEREHSYLSDAEYPAAMAALLDWIDHGTQPTPAAVAERCAQTRARFDQDGKNGCHFQAGYEPPPLATRVPEAVQ